MKDKINDVFYELKLNTMKKLQTTLLALLITTAAFSQCRIETTQSIRDGQTRHVSQRSGGVQFTKSGDKFYISIQAHTNDPNPRVGYHNAVVLLENGERITLTGEIQIEVNAANQYQYRIFSSISEEDMFSLALFRITAYNMIFDRQMRVRHGNQIKNCAGMMLNVR